MPYGGIAAVVGNGGGVCVCAWVRAGVFYFKLLILAEKENITWIIWILNHRQNVVDKCVEM